MDAKGTRTLDICTDGVGQPLCRIESVVRPDLALVHFESAPPLGCPHRVVFGQGYLCMARDRISLWLREHR